MSPETPTVETTQPEGSRDDVAACVRYGFCVNVCPTYAVLNSEHDARKRIYADAAMKPAIRHILAMHTPEARRRYALTPEQWQSITAPTLVLWTSHDPTASVEVGRALAGLIPGSRFEVMDGCGHWPQFEDAVTFNRIHIEFLRS